VAIVWEREESKENLLLALSKPPSGHTLSGHEGVTGGLFKLEGFPVEGSKRDRRTVSDRRQKPTRPHGRYILSGRRQTIRRESDRKTHLYVDRYGHRLFISLLLIIVLSVLDAYLTIFHLDNGAQEINPLMNSLIDYGYIYFFLVKYVLTALAVFILCLYKNWIPVRVAILCILALYFVVFAHHIFWVLVG
jgi:hypothetical protein